MGIVETLIPQPRLGDALILIGVAGVVSNVTLTVCSIGSSRFGAQGVHGIFKRYEPPEISHHAGLLLGVPSLLSLLLWNHYSPVRALVTTIVTFLAALVTSVVFYRLSPFHPLAKYPGPLYLKISRIPLTWIAMQGKEHLVIQKLHDWYGDVVRISEVPRIWYTKSSAHDS